MNPVFSVEFTVQAADGEFKEESVAIHSPDELFAYVAPGGGCEQIPSEVGEINIVFLKPPHANNVNPIADLKVTLQLGMVFLTGPLAESIFSQSFLCLSMMFRNVPAAANPKSAILMTMKDR